mmetsp:Transcript_3531/g.4685  ORF Transcript_3531/g.4685 Transcript_3531/m.4685 type:complete len:229 (+) Transcript_3531:56-742(+)
MKERVFRPNLDDVERLSYGNGAKKRGTGSKYVCHRLNQNERRLYDLAKEAGFLSIKGTGYRKERKGSPLCNTFRQRCDALEKLCIIIEKRIEGDRILIDFSTLRVKNDSPHVSLVMENVLKTKYPDLYKIAQNHCKNSKVDWEKVQMNPIWGVNERFVQINCDRDVARSLAVDVLKESLCFHKKIIDRENEIVEETVQKLEHANEEERSIAENEYDQDEDDGIDWDDI